MQDTVVIIPARYGSQRLNAKALAIIHDKPLVAHVLAQATAADIGDVFVATDHAEIAAVVEHYGGKAIMTPNTLETGTDRVAAAIETLPNNYQNIINVQGDLPFIQPEEIGTALIPLQHGYDVGTLVTCMDSIQQKNHHCVKAIISSQEGDTIKRCHWFCRAAMAYGHYHLGVYAYKRDALMRFQKTPPHPLEQQEKLEQLRFLVMGCTIGANLISALALEVNTAEDLQAVREHAKAAIS